MKLDEVTNNMETGKEGRNSSTVAEALPAAAPGHLLPVLLVLFGRPESCVSEAPGSVSSSLQMTTKA